MIDPKLLDAAEQEIAALNPELYPALYGAIAALRSTPAPATGAVEVKPLETALNLIGEVHHALAYQNVGGGRAKLAEAARILRETISAALPHLASAAEAKAPGAVSEVKKLVGILGHIDHGKTSLTAAVVRALTPQGVLNASALKAAKAVHRDMTAGITDRVERIVSAYLAALTAQPQAVPEGMVLVPREPTREHIERLAALWGYTIEEAADSYGALLDALAASPAVQGGE